MRRHRKRQSRPYQNHRRSDDRDDDEIHRRFQRNQRKLQRNVHGVVRRWSREAGNRGKSQRKSAGIGHRNLRATPGKRMLNISSYSGGEQTLIAIAILFAIIKMRPMPFCVLDEIDTALDDANAGLLAKYLKHFSERTQFIIISHRKPTMEIADNIFGVSMEERGVSTLCRSTCPKR